MSSTHDLPSGDDVFQMWKRLPVGTRTKVAERIAREMPDVTWHSVEPTDESRQAIAEGANPANLPTFPSVSAMFADLLDGRR